MASPELAVEVITGKAEEAGAIAWMSDQLGAFNQTIFEGKAEPFTAIIKGNDGTLKAGLGAWYIRGGSFFVERLIVEESLRGSGLGRDLMGAAETCAGEAQCLHLRVTTFSFQAPKFYEALGFSEIARLPGGRDGDFEIFLLKALS